MLICALLAGGCAPGLRGDGALAVIGPEAALGATVMTDSSGVPGGPMLTEHFTLEDAYCQGAHLWDAAGAQVRCTRELHPGAPVDVPVRFASATESSLEEGGVAAWYNAVDHTIRIKSAECVQLTVCAAIAAHEIGHALGLGHLPPGALMAPHTDAQALTDADLRAFHAAWM